MSADDFENQEENKPHTEFEARIKKTLLDMGYIYKKTGYHDLFPRYVTEEIKTRDDPIFRRWRALPDIEVIDKDDSGYRFFIDVKTSRNYKGQAWIEALPWAYNIEREAFTDRTIYMYRNENENTEKAFFASDFKVISKIDHILYRNCKPLSQDEIRIIENHLKKYRRITDLKPPARVSGDCSAIINREQIHELDNLDDFIEKVFRKETLQNHGYWYT